MIMHRSSLATESRVPSRELNYDFISRPRLQQELPAFFPSDLDPPPSSFLMLLFAYHFTKIGEDRKRRKRLAKAEAFTANLSCVGQLYGTIS
jgi:hypothetical protein